MTQVVAVTGGIGTGKSEVCHAFAALEVPIVDLDAIAHAMSAPHSPVMQQVKVRFGDAVFDQTGQLNRTALREVVFADAHALEDLNAIMHPAIRNEAIQQIAHHSEAPYVILAIPLLAESRADWSMITHVIVVDCEEALQVTRVMQRSQLSAEMAHAIISAQASRADRLKIADTVLENQTSLADLQEKVLNFHKKYLKTCLTFKTIS